MTVLSRLERISATGAALLFTGVTAYVLLEDVFKGGSVTPSHLLTGIAILGSILGGLWGFRVLQAGQKYLGFLLILLTASATLYVGISAAARNASGIQTKLELKQSLVNDVAKLRADHDRLKADVAQECRKVGTQCQAKQKLLEAAWDAVLKAEQRRDAFGPVTDYSNAAKTFSAFTGVQSEAVDRWLTLLMPFLLVMVAELGTICFWHLAITHGSPKVETKPESNVIEWVSEFQRKHNRKPQLPELQEAFPSIPRTTLWRRMKTA